MLYTLLFAPVLLLEPVAKRVGTAREASCLQFAPELRSVVASLLPALFNKLPMGFNGRMTKATDVRQQSLE